MKKIYLTLLIAIVTIKGFTGNPIYVSFNQSYLVEESNKINYHGLNVWEFDKDSMTLTFFYNMKTFPIISWEDSENNRKEIAADLGEFTAVINIASPWLMGVYFLKPNEDGTYNSMFMEIFYLEELPDWFVDDEVESFWSW